MAAGLVIVDVSRVRAGKLDEVKAAFRDLAAFVEADEPRAIAYQVHIDAETHEVTVIQAHPDAGSAERHMTLAGPRFAPFARLLELVRIDVYGTASEALLEQLRQKASLLGGAALSVHAFHAGFARAAGAGPAATIER